MEEKLICITTVKSRIEAEQMLSFLKENGIYAAIQGGVPGALYRRLCFRRQNHGLCRP